MISRYLHFSCCFFFSFLSCTAIAQTFPDKLHAESNAALVIMMDRTAKHNSEMDNLQLAVQSNRPSVTAFDVLYETNLVRFVDVTVKNSGNKPQLTWQVTDEQHVAYYSIERSYNGSFFEESGKAPFKNATTALNTYSFTDHNLAAEAEVYYRIKQVDVDGKYLYSKIVSLKLAQSSAIQLVPNPAYDKTEVQVISNRQQTGWLQLVDPSGVVVKKQNITLKKGMNKVPIEGLQQFGNGTYFVQVVLPEGTLYKKLLLQ